MTTPTYAQQMEARANEREDRLMDQQVQQLRAAMEKKIAQNRGRAARIGLRDPGADARYAQKLQAARKSVAAPRALTHGH